MKMLRDPRLLVRGFSFLALLLATAGCGGLKPTGSHVVGHLAPRTGPEQAAGLRQGLAVAMTVEDFNVVEENRIERLPITVIHGDTGPEIDGFGFQATRLLAVNHAEALLGATRAAELDKLAPEVQSGQVVLVSPCGGNAGTLNRLIFSVGLDPRERGRLLASFAVEERKVTEIALVTSGSQAIFAAATEAFAREFQHADRKIRHELTYRERKELDEIVARLRGAKPGALFFSGPVADLLALRAVMKEVPIFFGGEECEAALRPEAQASEGIVFATAFHADAGSPKAKDFVTKLQARSKQQLVDADDALSADAARLLFDAAKKANSFDKEKLTTALNGLEGYECLTGPFWFTPEQSARRTVYIAQMAAGKSSLLKEYPPEKK